MLRLSLKYPWVIASDHGGFAMKKRLCGLFSDLIDVGTHAETPCDYPDYVSPFIQTMREKNARGLLICRSGLGMSIAANRFSGIRACLCRTEKDVQLARAHNGMNVMVIGADYTPLSQVLRWISIAEMQEPEPDLRHQNRLKKIDALILQN